jgi:hypothetical protein
MSKLLRLPFALLAVLVLFLLSPGIASAETTPSPEDCQAVPAPAKCDTSVENGTTDGTVTDPPTGPSDPSAGGGGSTAGGSTAGDSSGGGSGAAVPAYGPGSPGWSDSSGTDAATGRSASLADGTPVDAVGDLPAPPPLQCNVPGAPTDLCANFNQACSALAALLGQTECPSGATCENLSALVGHDLCAAPPASCEDLAAMLGLPVSECPGGTPTCQEFADLLGVDNCDQIPCIDISQVPEQAKAGLKPLLDALEQLGIHACPAATPPPSGGSQQPPPTGTGTTGQPVSNVQPPPAVTPTATTQPTTQPTQTLAYTGVDVWGMVRLSLILVSGGTLVLLAGVRRAA